MQEDSDSLLPTSKASPKKLRIISYFCNLCLSPARDSKLPFPRTFLRWFLNCWRESGWYGTTLNSTNRTKGFQACSIKFRIRSSKGAKPTLTLMTCLMAMLKSALRTWMMPLSVVKNGDKFTISSWKLSTLLNQENGNLVPTLSLLQSKPLFKGAPSWSKFAKGSFSLH